MTDNNYDLILAGVSITGILDPIYKPMHINGGIGEQMTVHKDNKIKLLKFIRDAKLTFGQISQLSNFLYARFNIVFKAMVYEVISDLNSMGYEYSPLARVLLDLTADKQMNKHIIQVTDYLGEQLDLFKLAGDDYDDLTAIIAVKHNRPDLFPKDLSEMYIF